MSHSQFPTGPKVLHSSDSEKTFIFPLQVTEWLITPSWQKSVFAELIFLLLLLLSNLLLLFAVSRHRPDELLPWLVLHTLALAALAVLFVSLLVTIALVAFPATQVHQATQNHLGIFYLQNSALSLPRGMSTSSPEFLRAQRWTLGVAVAKLLVLSAAIPTTAYGCWVVFHDRRAMLVEEVKYCQDMS